MNLKKNGSDHEYHKKENENRDSENITSKMFGSSNFNGFNTSRGGFFNRESINFNNNNTNNNYDSMAKSKLRIINSESPIKIQTNRENNKNNKNNEDIQNNQIKMDFNNTNNYKIHKQNIEDRSSRNNSIGKSIINTEEEILSPKLTK